MLFRALDVNRTRHLRLKHRTWRPLGSPVLVDFVISVRKQESMYEVGWVFYPGNIFLVDLYHETLGPGFSIGSYPFPFEIKFFFQHPCKNPFI